MGKYMGKGALNMRRYRICENKKGQFKIQFKALGLIWLDWQQHYGANTKLFATYEEAEKHIKKFRIWKAIKRINKIKKNSWRCRDEY